MICECCGEWTAAHNLNTACVCTACVPHYTKCRLDRAAEDARRSAAISAAERVVISAARAWHADRFMGNDSLLDNLSAAVAALAEAEGKRT